MGGAFKLGIFFQGLHCLCDYDGYYFLVARLNFHCSLSRDASNERYYTGKYACTSFVVESTFSESRERTNGNSCIVFSLRGGYITVAICISMMQLILTSMFFLYGAV